MKKNVLKIMLGSIIAEVILVCIFILVGEFNEIAIYSLQSVASIFFFSIPCLFYSKISDMVEYNLLIKIGVISASAETILITLIIWEILESSIILENIIYLLFVLICLLSLISEVLSYSKTNLTLNIFKKITIYSNSILSLFISGIIIYDDFPDGFLERLFWVILVVSVGSFICTLILKTIVKKNSKSNIIENNNASNTNVPQSIANETPTMPMRNINSINNINNN